MKISGGNLPEPDFLPKPALAAVVQKIEAADSSTLLDASPPVPATPNQAPVRAPINAMEITGGSLPPPNVVPDRAVPHQMPAAPAHAIGKSEVAALVQQPVRIADAAMLLAVAPADLVKLGQILQPQQTPEHAAQAQVLMKEAALAVSGGNADKAVAFLAEAVKLNPLQLEELRTLPPLRLEAPADVNHQPDAVQAPDPKPELFAMIHADVEHMASRLTTVAKLDADVKLSQAETAIEAAGGAKLQQWETHPHTLLQIGHRLYEAGGYQNYVRAADLATAIQTAYWEDAVIYEQAAVQKRARTEEENQAVRNRSRPPIWQIWSFARRKIPEGTRLLWFRAPLLVLLLGWLFAGVTGGIATLVLRNVWPLVSDGLWIESWAASLSDFGFKLWGLGFLALVGFGFYAAIRPRAQ